ncbi:MAG: acyloxyacyl hydrolase [bacterium]
MINIMRICAALQKSIFVQSKAGASVIQAMCSGNLGVLTSGFRVIVLISLLALLVPTARGQDLKWSEVGARFGFGGTVHGENFHQLELVTVSQLPWVWQLDNDWILDSRINASAGVLHHDGGDSAVIVTLGPGLALVSPSRQYAIETGINPTLVSKHEFDDADFGGSVQFTSFIGLRSRIDERFTATFRIQHMSNAGIYSHNPGLDQVMLGVNYRF